jgi:hypothetical protein
MSGIINKELLAEDVTNILKHVNQSRTVAEQILALDTAKRSLEIVETGKALKEVMKKVNAL